MFNQREIVRILIILSISTILPFHCIQDDVNNPGWEAGPYSQEIQVSLVEWEDINSQPYYHFAIRVTDRFGTGYPEIEINLYASCGNLYPDIGYTDENGELPFLFDSTSCCHDEVTLTTRLLGHEYEFFITL